MNLNGKRRRCTNDYDDRQPAQRQKVSDTSEAPFPPISNTSPLRDQSFSTQPLAAFSAIPAMPSNMTLNMPGSAYLSDSVQNTQYQEPETVPGYSNDNKFCKGRDFDLEIVLDRNDSRLNNPCYHLLQNIASYQPGDALSHVLVAHGQLFLDDHRNLVRIKPKQPLASATENLNNEINSSVYNGHIGYIPCPNTADGLTEEEFNARLEEWVFQVPRDLPATLTGWSFDAWMVLIRSGVRGFGDNAGEGIQLQPQQPPVESYIPVVDHSQALPNNSVYPWDVSWTVSNPEVFGSWIQDSSPGVLSRPNVTVPDHDAAHLTPAGVLQQPPAPQRRARQAKASEQTGTVSQQVQRINPYAPGGLFAQEFSQHSEVSAVHKTPADRSAAILAERATPPPVVMPAPSKRQKGQKQARQTRDSRAAVRASNPQPSRKRKAPDSNLDAQMPSITLAPNANLHNMMDQPTESQPAKRAKRNFEQQAPASFNLQATARPHQRPTIPREALSRSNIAEAMDEWNQGEEQFQQRQQAILQPEQYFRPESTLPNPLARQEYVPAHFAEEFTFEETPSSGFELGYETSWINTLPSAESNIASNVQPTDSTAFDADGFEAILEYLNNSALPAENMQLQDTPFAGTQ